MADFFETVVKNFSGLSSETKPTIAAGSNVPNGSRWREVDTSKTYFFNESDDTWYEIAPKVIITDGTNDVEINADGQLHVVLMGNVDAGNSSITPLPGDTGGADHIFTGAATNTLDFGFIFVTVFADQDSAADGLSFQQSSDGTNWDNVDEYNYLINTGKTYSIQPAAQWFRVVYTNGVAAQSAFRLNTVFKKTSSLPSSHRISENLSPEDDASLGISIIKGQNPSGNYVDFSATNGGNFKVSLEELESGVSSNSNSQLNITPFSSNGNEGIQLQDQNGTAYGVKHISNKPRTSSMDYLYDIAEGNVADHIGLNKFGHNETVGAAWETIWTPSVVYPYMTVADQLEIVSDGAEDVNITGDGAWTVQISGLDANWDEISETINMTGATQVVTTASFIRVFRAKVLTAGATGVNEGEIIIRDQDTNTTRAQIDPSIGQTLMAVWTVPDGYTFYMTSWYAGSAVTKAIDIGVFARDNAVANASLQNKQFINFSDTTFKYKLELPILFTSRTDIEVRAKASGGGGDISAGFNGWYEL